MIEIDRERFGDALFATMEIYGREVSEMVIHIWWNSLKSFEVDLVCRALQRHIMDPDTGQFAPKPADVLKYLVGSRQGVAMLAWSKVDKTVKSVGGAGSIVFDDVIIHNVIEDMGGWSTLCKLSENDLIFKANEFEKRYKAYQLNPPTVFTSKLIGTDEAYNKRESFNVEGPYLIGDPKKALCVLESGVIKPRLQITGPRSLAVLVEFIEN
ncbi:MAG: phosphohydrolase [Alteromonadaceae bacterium]|nr:phosphohydrolase [Alteromonadaceae bacterium]